MNQSEDERLRLRIHGMDCAEEVSILKRELVPLVGSDDRLGFDLLNGKLTVNLDGADVTQGDVLAAIERTGLRAEVWDDVPDRDSELTFWQPTHSPDDNQWRGRRNRFGIAVVARRSGRKPPSDCDQLLSGQHRDRFTVGASQGVAFAGFATAGHEFIDVRRSCRGDCDR